MLGVPVSKATDMPLVCTMTGHNHYVMCAQFHPTEDLIASASLDQSVRIWDISGLRKKHSAPTSMSFEDQMARANPNQADMFGNTDAIVKFVLEGHDRGVNWVSFHPTLPLLVSAGDDRLIKLWRMSGEFCGLFSLCTCSFPMMSCIISNPLLFFHCSFWCPDMLECALTPSRNQGMGSRYLPWAFPERFGLSISPSPGSHPLRG